MLYFCNLLKAIVYIWWLRRGNFFKIFFSKPQNLCLFWWIGEGGSPSGESPQKFFVLLPKSYKFFCFILEMRAQLCIIDYWLLVATLLLCSFGFVGLFWFHCTMHNQLFFFQHTLTFVVVEEEFCHVKNMGNKIISWHRLYWNLARCIWFYLVVVVVFTKEVISMNFLPRICFCSFAMFFFRF